MDKTELVQRVMRWTDRNDSVAPVIRIQKLAVRLELSLQFICWDGPLVVVAWDLVAQSFRENKQWRLVEILQEG